MWFASLLFMMFKKICEQMAFIFCLLLKAKVAISYSIYFPELLSFAVIHFLVAAVKYGNLRTSVWM